MGEVTYNAEAIHEKFHDLAGLRAFACRQIAHWDRIRQESFEMKPEFIKGGGPMIWSYTNHVVELMRTILDLSAQHRMIIAVPLIRLVVENAMTPIWLYLEPSNARAVIHEGFRLRKAAAENIIETGSGSVDKSQVDEIKQVLDEFADSDLPGGRHFEQRCLKSSTGCPSTVRGG